MSDCLGRYTVFMISDLFEHCVCGEWMINGFGLHENGGTAIKKAIHGIGDMGIGRSKIPCSYCVGCNNGILG